MTIREPSYHADRVVLGERLPLATPLSVILDLSERCNFRCSYCFRSGEKDASWSFAAAGELMSPEVFEKAARQLHHVVHHRADADIVVIHVQHHVVEFEIEKAGE